MQTTRSTNIQYNDSVIPAHTPSMIKFTFTILAIFPFCCSDLCAAAYHKLAGTTIGARGFIKAVGCSAAKKGKRIYKQHQREEQRNNYNRGYNTYGY